MTSDETKRYADLLSVLNFEELKDSPLTEKFQKRQLNIVNMPYIGAWDKIMISNYVSFIPILNLVIIHSLGAYKESLHKLYVQFIEIKSIDLLFSHNLVREFAMDVGYVLLRVLVIKLVLEVVKW
jgi:hypothetical protein